MSHLVCSGGGSGCRRHRYTRLEPVLLQGSLPLVLLRIGAVAAVVFATLSAATLLLFRGQNVVDGAQQGGGTDAARSRLAEEEARSSLATLLPLEDKLQVRVWNAYAEMDRQQQQQQLDAYGLENLAEPFRPAVMQVHDQNGEVLRGPKMRIR